jgi:CheY-like chemotaxis protein/AraC-like DNA-binding protein
LTIQLLDDKISHFYRVQDTIYQSCRQGLRTDNWGTQNGHVNTFDELEQQLRKALKRLYDPAYRPPSLLSEAVGCDPQQGEEALQAALIRAIDELKPAPNVPQTARIRRIYELLCCRYVQHLTQEETAARLSISPRHLRREQQEAVHVLAQRLWEQCLVAAPAGPGHPPVEDVLAPEEVASGAEMLEWRSQVRRELASLQKSAPTTVTDVEGALRGVVELRSAPAARRGIELEVGWVQSNLFAAIHRSALRQTLITAIGKLVQHMSSGQILLGAERKEGRVVIAITGCPVAVESVPTSDLIREILATHGGTVQIDVDDGCVSFLMELPSVDEVTVLVVEDNEDLVHVYRRYTAGTRYHILHAAQEKHVFELIESSAPDIIVLDVMLPEVDGWELLTHLREHPVTNAVPIIVCSVVREEELALDLGAALYLPKPVRRRQFLQALDQVLSQT